MTEKELVYDEIEVGRRFDPPPFTVTEEAAEKYRLAVEDDNPIYGDEKAAREAGLGGAVVPPTIAAVFTRTSVLLQEAGKMPPGSIHARQEFQFLAPIRPGDTLDTKAEVVDKFIRKERKWMAIQCTTTNQRGETVVIGKITAIWPK